MGINPWQGLEEFFQPTNQPSHHQKMRPIYLYEPKISKASRPECEGVLKSQAQLAPRKIASRTEGSSGMPQAQLSTLASQTDHSFSTPTSLYVVDSNHLRTQQLRSNNLPRLSSTKSGLNIS
jgi:hypothetical protein